MITSSPYLPILGTGVIVLCLIHYYLTSEHRKRKVSRGAIFDQLYGPRILSAIVVFIGFYLTWQLSEFSLAKVTFLIVSIPLLVQLTLSLFMVAKIIPKQTRFRHDANLKPSYHPKVAIIFPTYKEPFDVARMTLDSITSMKYQGQVTLIVVDNSEDYDDLETWKAYVVDQGRLLAKAGVEIHWVSRDPNKKGYKPLNLDEAFNKHIATDNDVEYIMYVDTDSTFNEGTLNELIHEFNKTPEVGYIQLMTVANNMGINRLSKVVGMQQTIFRFVLGEIGNWGIPIFYGHNAIFRRDVVENVGAFLETDSHGELILTEDFSITIRSYLKGYYGKTHWLLSGEGVPTSLKALKGMWERWSIGGLQVLTKYMIPALRSSKMNLYEKASFLFHGLCYPAHAVVPILILISPLFPRFAILAISLTAINSVISIIGFKKNFSHLLANKSNGQVTDYLLAFFTINTYIIWIMFRSSWKFLFNSLVRKKRKSSMTWIVTPKGREKKLSTYSVFRANLDIAVFTSLFIITTYYALLKGILDTSTLPLLLPGIFFLGNLLLTVLVFGQSRRVSTEAKESQSPSMVNPNGTATNRNKATIPGIDIPTKELI